ncbi:hypothetical protein OIU85_014312, partial [Salix viminalis]
RENPTAVDPELTSPRSGLTIYAARLKARARRGVMKRSGSDSSVVNSLQKPEEPDFSVDEE